MCGENWNLVKDILTGAGSSPRVRGKLAGSVVPIQDTGLIPACAGKTCVRRLVIGGPEAHPRVCGENLKAKVHDLAAEWLIPACAGKT